MSGSALPKIRPLISCRRGLAVLFAAGAALGFAPAALAATPDQAPAAQSVLSPEVVHTGAGPTGYSVTFRYYDGNPNTTNVKIRGEWYLSDVGHTTTTTSAGRLPSQYQPGDFPIASPNSGAAPNWPVLPMTQDPTTHVWSLTTPLPSGTWTYGFLLDCTDDQPNSTAGCPTSGEIADPGNPPWNATGSTEPTSQVYVPSDPAFGTGDLSWQAPNPVHGTLTDVSYPDPQSTNPAGSHPLAVYLPPGYNARRGTPYPTLYLSHGGGGNEVDWSTQGAAGNIADDLIASGQVQPMVVVMTNFNGLPNGNDGYRADLLNNVIPFVESHYNVSDNANDRAFAGLSAGGSRANNILFNAPTAFGYFGIWSIGLGGAPAAASPLWQNPDLKSRLAIQSGGGLFDSITVPGTSSYLQLMANNGIAVSTDFIQGGHEWYTWRQLLHDYLTTLAFRHTTTTASARAQGNALILSADVAADTTEPTAVTGTVRFYLDGVIDNAHVLGTATVHHGAAQVVTRPVSGTHTVTAVYSGDGLYNTSTSGAAAPQ
jgi:enterochelin esterase-like enzyme